MASILVKKSTTSYPVSKTKATPRVKPDNLPYRPAGTFAPKPEAKSFKLSERSKHLYKDKS